LNPLNDDELGVQLRVAECVVAVPDPESGIANGELLALLTIETLPDALPVAVGAKLTENDVDWPGVSVSGRPSPETAKLVPVTLSEESDTLAFPVFVSVTVLELLVPVATLPKLSEAGETPSCRICATPVPPRATLTDGVGELFASVSVPEKVPAEVGAKLTVKEDEPPAAMLSGNVNPEYAKPAPDSDAWVTLRLAVPGFEMVTVCVLVTPLVTLPKLTDAGVTAIAG